MRVVFVVLDGLPARHAGPLVTPHLAALAADGAASVGRAVLTSATYPNHATFATGVGPEAHGLVANWVVAGGTPRPAEAVGPAVPTLFDACRASGRMSLAVVGDQHLVAVMGAARADAHWPPDGVLPDVCALDAHGYAADREVTAVATGMLDGDGADLVVVQLNEPDTAGHDFGPDSDAALDAYRRTDAALGEILEALRPAWDETVVMVVSDHDMETMDPDLPSVDVYEPLASAGLDLIAIPEGTGAVIWGDDPTAGSWLDTVEGVAGHAEVRRGVRLVWAVPGRPFALPPGFEMDVYHGHHGGMRTRDQVAVVGGGHPGSAQVAGTLRRRAPDATDWAPTIARLLSLDLPEAAGRALA